jgi:hypothetical protein
VGGWIWNAGSRNETGSAWSHGVVLIVPGEGIRVGDGRHHALPIARLVPASDKNTNRKQVRALLVFQAPGGDILSLGYFQQSTKSYVLFICRTWRRVKNAEKNDSY